MKKYIFTILLCVFSQSCSSSDLSYDYLILHPKKLEKAYKSCEATFTEKCREVERAAKDFTILSYTRARDPQKFGKSILHLQENTAKLYKEYLALKKSSDKQKAELIFKDYQEQIKKLNVLYAVVASTGPGQ